MGSKPELDVAHRRLLKEWPGTVRRIRYPGRAFFPDYILSYNGHVAFVEMKAVRGPNVKIKVTSGQIDELENLALEGLTACLLTLVGDEFWEIQRPIFFKHGAIYVQPSGEIGKHVTPDLIFSESRPHWSSPMRVTLLKPRIPRPD